MLSAEELVNRHLALFNAGVRAGDFTAMLGHFTQEAEMRFENVPGAGVLEYRGLGAITAAYAERPPTDQIDATGKPYEEQGTVVVPFRWRAGGGTGTLRLTRLARTSDRIARLVVVFA